MIMSVVATFGGENYAISMLYICSRPYTLTSSLSDQIFSTPITNRSLVEKQQELSHKTSYSIPM